MSYRVSRLSRYEGISEETISRVLVLVFYPVLWILTGCKVEFPALFE